MKTDFSALPKECIPIVETSEKALINFAENFVIPMILRMGPFLINTIGYTPAGQVHMQLPTHCKLSPDVKANTNITLRPDIVEDSITNTSETVFPTNDMLWSRGFVISPHDAKQSEKVARSIASNTSDAINREIQNQIMDNKIMIAFPDSDRTMQSVYICRARLDDRGRDKLLNSDYLQADRKLDIICTIYEHRLEMLKDFMGQVDDLIENRIKDVCRILEIPVPDQLELKMMDEKIEIGNMLLSLYNTRYESIIQAGENLISSLSSIDDVINTNDKADIYEYLRRTSSRSATLSTRIHGGTYGYGGSSYDFQLYVSEDASDYPRDISHRDMEHDMRAYEYNLQMAKRNTIKGVTVYLSTKLSPIIDPNNIRNTEKFTYEIAFGGENNQKQWSLRDRLEIMQAMSSFIVPVATNIKRTINDMLSQ